MVTLLQFTAECASEGIFDIGLNLMKLLKLGGYCIGPADGPGTEN